MAVFSSRVTKRGLFLITVLLFVLALFGMSAQAVVHNMEYRNLDGSGNNPNGGEAHTPLLRMAIADYEDGQSEPAGWNRPSTREISNVVSAQEEPIFNPYNRSNFIWAWGQFLDHNIGITEGQDGSYGPVEHFPIPVPLGDPHFDPYYTGTQEIDMTRSDYLFSSTPRQQMNALTSFIDAAAVYGVDSVRNDALRSKTECGKLDVTPHQYGDLLPYNVYGLPNAGGDTREDLFLAGDIRANEHVVLTSLHTLFVREHNRWVDELSKANSSLSCETLYQEAKVRVEAIIQAITFNEFLPSLLGENAIPAYKGYQSWVDPSMMNEFSTAAYRFGHSLIQEVLHRYDERGREDEYGHTPLKGGFFNPAVISEQNGIDSILRGSAAGRAQKVDTKITDSLRNFLFGDPGQGGFDLAALNMQRGRDHGLPDYNTLRKSFGLKPVFLFSQITSDVELQIKLKNLYGNVNNIDAWLGCLAEDPVEGSMLGELAHTILVKQFWSLREGDRFWYEERLAHQPDLLNVLHKTRLSDVIKRNTGIQYMQKNVFQAYNRMGGTEYSDILYGTDGDDMMIGFSGNNIIVVDEGNNYLIAGEDNDILVGGEGNDILEAGPGRNLLVGRGGKNTFYVNLVSRPRGLLLEGSTRIIDLSENDVLEFGGNWVKSIEDLDKHSTFRYSSITRTLYITFDGRKHKLMLQGFEFRWISSFEQLVSAGYTVKF